jgi:chromosome segregation ATPase
MSFNIPNQDRIIERSIEKCERHINDDVNRIISDIAPDLENGVASKYTKEIWDDISRCIDVFKQVISDLSDKAEDEIKDLEKRKNELEDDIYDKEIEIDALKDNVNTLEDTITDLESKITDLEDDIKALQGRLNEHE